MSGDGENLQAKHCCHAVSQREHPISRPIGIEERQGKLILWLIKGKMSAKSHNTIQVLDNIENSRVSLNVNDGDDNQYNRHRNIISAFCSLYVLNKSSELHHQSVSAVFDDEEKQEYDSRFLKYGMCIDYDCRRQEHRITLLTTKVKLTLELARKPLQWGQVSVI